MTWDFTLTVMLPTTAEGWGQWDTAMVGAYRVGSPISVREHSPFKTPSLTTHQGFGHITGVPDTISPQNLRERITGPWLDGSTPPSVVERVGWLVRSDLMTPEGRAFFLHNRFISTDWQTLKAVSWSLAHERVAIDEDFI